MSTAPSAFDPELVDQTRQQLRSLVHEIESLSRSELSPTEFYEGFLNRIVTALAAVGGAVWALEDGRFRLAYQTNLQQTRLAESEENQQKHGLLLRKVAEDGQGALIAPQSGGDGDEAGNPTEFLLVLAALKSDKDVQGVVEIFQRPGGRPTVERGYLRFLLQMCDLAGDFLKTRHLRLFADRQLMWTQLEQFTRLVHEGLDPSQTAYTIANEGRRLIGCDRVSVALRRGRKSRVVAISGQETMDNRSNTVTLLGKLATVVVAGGDELWYTGDTTDLPPQIEEAVEVYADDAHSKLVAVLPLARPRDDAADDEHHPPDYLGALIIEQITDDALTESMRRRIDVVAEHSALALTNARDHNDLFLMPLWRGIGKLRWIVSARTLPKTIAIACTVLLLLLALFLIPAPFQMSGKGKLEPVVKADVFSPVEGVIEKVLVQPGEKVKSGQLLMVMKNPTLNVDLRELEGKVDTARAQIESKDRTLRNDRHLSREQKSEVEGQRAELVASLKTYQAQLALEHEKQQQLEVRSPIDGEVVTWQLEKLLNRPVERGNVLLTVADTNGPWRLEIDMPEDRMGPVARADNELKNDPDRPDTIKGVPVSYILATSPGQSRQGTLTEIARLADVKGDEGNVVLLHVAIDKEDYDPSDLRPGATVTAKVDCGTATLGYVWFHDLFAFVQSRILFRFLP